MLWGADENVDYSGGFAELSVLPMVNLVGFARLDLINQCEDYGFDVNRYTVGGRYYLEDNVAVHAEYSYRMVKDAVVSPVGTSVVEIRGDAISSSLHRATGFRVLGK